MLLVSIIFNGEGILPEQGVGRGSQEWARRIDTGSVRLLRHMGKKQIILIFDFYLKTSVYASEPLILLEEKLYFFCLSAADDVHGSGKNEDGHLHHDRHPDMPGWKTAGSDGWDNRQRRKGRYLWQRLSICRKHGRRLPGLPGEGSRRCGLS
jgi:hypothetical protein